MRSPQNTNWLIRFLIQIGMLLVGSWPHDRPRRSSEGGGRKSARGSASDPNSRPGALPCVGVTLSWFRQFRAMSSATQAMDLRISALALTQQGKLLVVGNSSGNGTAEDVEGALSVLEALGHVRRTEEAGRGRTAVKYIVHPSLRREGCPTPRCSGSTGVTGFGRACGGSAKASGVPMVTAHGMRGLHSTLAMAAGETGHVVAGSLSHASVATTVQSYAKPEAVAGAQQRRTLTVLTGGAA
jgi:hypothetical protein